MGSRGPIKTPNLHAIDGGADHRRAPAPPKLAAPHLPKPPRWVSIFGADKQAARDATSEWKRVVPELHRLGALARLDESVLVDYCICHARVLQLERELTAGGWTTESERGTVKNQASVMLNQYRTSLQRYQSDLGLTPMARTRLGLKEPPIPDDDSDLDEPAD